MADTISFKLNGKPARLNVDGDRLLLVNMGTDLHLNPAPEPLLAPLEGRRWILLWSSEDPRYGGAGIYPPDSDENWRLPGHAAVVLRPSSPEEDAAGVAHA